MKWNYIDKDGNPTKSGTYWATLIFSGWDKEKQKPNNKKFVMVDTRYFGDAFEKTTCLWLKGLPKLQKTEVVKPPPRTVFKSGKTMATFFAKSFGMPSEERSRFRSKTFHGIAVAMAEQWAGKNVSEVYEQKNLW